MELAQIVIFKELSGPDDRLEYDKTRPYKRFPSLAKKFVLITAKLLMEE